MVHLSACTSWSKISSKIWFINLHCFEIFFLNKCLIFRYKKREERAPLNEAMNLLLPMMYNLMVRLLPDESEQSVLLQKQVLKVFYSLIQVILMFNSFIKL